MGISVTGVERTIQAQRGKAKAMGKNIAEGLRQGANALLKASQKLVPVQYGDLKKSGHVEVTGTGFSAVARVIYETTYAIWVHENLFVYHAPPTQARYLADAVPKVRGVMTRILKRQVTVGLGNTRVF